MKFLRVWGKNGDLGLPKTAVLVATGDKFATGIVVIGGIFAAGS
jgi:hypothetical protein